MGLRSAGLRVVIVGCLSPGCGAVRSAGEIERAQEELTKAMISGAASKAPYEVTAAELYLLKAREEQSRSEHGPAIELAERAWACARRAQGRRSKSDEPGTTRATCRPGPGRAAVAAWAEPASPLLGSEPESPPLLAEPESSLPEGEQEVPSLAAETEVLNPPSSPVAGPEPKPELAPVILLEDPFADVDEDLGSAQTSSVGRGGGS